MYPVFFLTCPGGTCGLTGVQLSKVKITTHINNNIITIFIFLSESNVVAKSASTTNLEKYFTRSGGVLLTLDSYHPTQREKAFSNKIFDLLKNDICLYVSLIYYFIVVNH